jgi:hypothetical protein
VSPRLILSAAAFLAALVFAASPGSALRDPRTPDHVPGDLELLVLEADGCLYCEVFRREVLPLYRASPASAKVPIRFVDIAQIADGSPLLSAPVTIVPTAVLLSEGREVGRVTGYAGPDVVVRLVSRRLQLSD